MTLDQLNALPNEAFIAALGEIFEHSPWVAAAVAEQRPFESIAELHAAMCAAVSSAGEAAQLALIRAHPRLASKAAIAGGLSASSNQEQSGAGLTQCSPQEFAQLNALNQAYDERFGFPFILAVRGHNRHSIIASLATRLERDQATEFAEALRQIDYIAEFRLHDLITA